MGINLSKAMYPGGIPDPVISKNESTYFIPTFENATIKSLKGGEWELNSQYFASEDTANYLKNKFFASEVFVRDFGGVGGPFICDKKERWLRWPDGLEINAGMLASYYIRGPERDFPGWAERGIWEAIGRARQTTNE